MDLSVIIISYNTREITRQCLVRLFAELGDLQAEVYVVDNASTDGSFEMLHSEFPSVRVIANDQNRGFGAANNQAIAHATAPAILLLNSDAWVHPTSVKRLLDTLDGHPDTGIVAPRLLNADGSLQPSVWPFPSPLRSWIEALGVSRVFNWTWHYRDWRHWDHASARKIPWAIGACLLLRREAVHAVEGFDEDFFLYGEETDLERRICNAGWAARFVPTAIVTHLGGSSGAGRPDAVFEEFHRANERYIHKHHGSIGTCLYRLAVLVGSAIRISTFWLLRRFRPRRHHAERLVMWKRVFRRTLGWRMKGLND